MAYDENLASRLRNTLAERDIDFVEKKMMGGLTFMVDEKMCVGIIKDELMARIGPEAYETALETDGCREMTFTGRPFIGYVLVAPHAMESDEQLGNWVQLALDYNPFAKASKKRKKKT